VSAPARWAIAVAGSLLAGVAISFGQTFAPDWLSSLFNSAAPVVALAAAASLAARRLPGSIALGAIAGPLAMVGYYGTALLRGYGVSSSFFLMWVAAGAVFGSLMGVATWALRNKAPVVVKAAAAALWPGIVVGEAAHGLTRIADTTSVAYWWVEAALGVAVLAWLVARRVPTTRARVLAVVFTAIIAVALFAIYGIA